jgi:hemolysin III
MFLCSLPWQYLIMLNSLKHPIRSLIGVIAVVFSVAATVLLVVRAAKHGSGWHVVSFCIYGISLIALWTISTLYHSLNVPRAVNRTLEQLDHAMIYFLIAGTYTPICLIVLHGSWGWSLFGVNWALAITGIVLRLVFRHPAKWLRILFFIFYIIMGWLVVIAWVPLTNAMPQAGVLWLIWGGIFYTVGAGIFNLRKLAPPRFGAHEIWHLFVLAGSFCHFWMMYQYVVYLKT